MSIGELFLLTVAFICNLVIANEWAKYGLLELGLQRPPNTRVMKAVMAGALTLIIAGIAQKRSGIEFVYLAKDPRWEPIAILIGIPFAWIFLKGKFFLPPGIKDYNRAISRIKHWMTTYYDPGKLFEERGKELREFDMAQKTLDLFKRSIEGQKKGVAKTSIRKVIDLTTVDLIGYGNSIKANCLNCGAPFGIPAEKLDGGTAMCNRCHTVTTVKKMDGKLYLNCFAKHREITDGNKKNVATAYEEMALLLRMMNRFDHALEALDEAEKITDEILGSDSKNANVWDLKSLIIFRRGEIMHVRGKYQEAKRLYQESLAIDQKFNQGKDSAFLKKMIESLPV